jgi:hypothetical protein
MTKGWANESTRHRLASNGVKTSENFGRYRNKERRAIIDGKVYDNILEMDFIKQKNIDIGHHFFSPKTMKFFKSKIISNYAFIDKNGEYAYFITSERNYNDTAREFKVRRINLDTWDIQTASNTLSNLNKTQAWETLTQLVG